MELSEEIRIAAPRDRVYAALNDPEVLKQCIPGCEELEQTADNEFAAKVTLKIGPVKARFNGSVTLDPSEAPERFSLKGEGKGGAAGFAKGGADVALKEDDGETVLSYDAKAEVGGKIAQLGSRLIQGTAKNLSAKFFSNFKDKVEEGGEAA